MLRRVRECERESERVRERERKDGVGVGMRVGGEKADSEECRE